MKLIHVCAHLRSNNQENFDTFDAVTKSEQSWSGKKQIFSKSCNQKVATKNYKLRIQVCICNLPSLFYVLLQSYFIYVVLIVSVTSSTSLLPKNIKMGKMLVTHNDIFKNP